MSSDRRTRWLASVLGGLATLTLLGATPARAMVQADVVLTWPASAEVGDLLSVSVLVVNTSTTPNHTEKVRLTTVFVTPACADDSSPMCTLPNWDPGVFKVLGAVGDVSTPPCAGTAFSVGVPDATTGEIALTPVAFVDLGPVSGNVDLSCQVNITGLRVFKVPTNPAPGPLFTTDPLARVTLFGKTSFQSGAGQGATEIRIKKGTVTIGSTSHPNTGNVIPGTVVGDMAKVAKPPGAIPPTGSVRFILCQPSEVTVSGCPGGLGTKVGLDKSLVNGSAISDLSANTRTLGKFCWRARYLGDANYKPRNHTDSTAECFTTQ